MMKINCSDSPLWCILHFFPQNSKVRLLLSAGSCKHPGSSFTLMKPTFVTMNQFNFCLMQMIPSYKDESFPQQEKMSEWKRDQLLLWQLDDSSCHISWSNYSLFQPLISLAIILCFYSFHTFYFLIIIRYLSENKIQELPESIFKGVKELKSVWVNTSFPVSFLVSCIFRCIKLKIMNEVYYHICACHAL